MKKDTKKTSGGRLRDIILSPAATIAMFAVAAILILISGMGGARAALQYFSEIYSSQVGMYHIGVTLVENDQDISWRNYSGNADGKWEKEEGKLLANMLEEDEEYLTIGKEYPEELKVRNSSDEDDSEDNPGINEFVRVTIYKYWMNESPYESDNKKKEWDLDPSLINLNFINTTDDGGKWILDEDASTDERKVLYYSELLDAGDTTDPFTDFVSIDQKVAKMVKQEPSPDDKTITTTYEYDGMYFAIEATVDAVQEHNAEHAILSAWGKDVKISTEGDTTTFNFK